MKYSTDLSSPSKMITISFLAIILLGAFLLMLPKSSTGHPLGFIDALFMSTSAVCVTGLTIVDVGAGLTRFGQTVLLVLFQCGGLGIMTFSLFFLFAFRVKTTLTARLALSSVSQKSDRQNLFHTLVFVFLMVMSFEMLGALLLFFRLKQDLPIGDAAFSAIFHSISAFCNAGFSLFPDSLMRFRHEFYFPLVMMVLIIIGGLGFVTIDDIREWIQSRLKGEHRRLSLHTRICLFGSLVLLIGGAGIIYILENRNSLLEMHLPLQLLNSFFLSATSRTAGFNTLETGLLSNATLFFVVQLMFIGGCPGSTAGGIKVTTFVVLFALIRAKIKGLDYTPIMGRKVPEPIIAKSLAIFAAGFLLVNLSTLIFQMTEHIGLSHKILGGHFLDFFFEATSAFATVGLSTGVTDGTTPISRVFLIILMLAGRIGPLTLGLAIMASHKKRLKYEYPEEDVMIG